MPDPPNLRIKAVQEFSLASENYSLSGVPDTSQLLVGGHTGKLQQVDPAACPVARDSAGNRQGGR